MTTNTQLSSDDLGNTISPDNASSLSIDSVLSQLDTWRKNKNNPSDPIPDHILQQIFALKNQHSESRLRAIFGLNSKQFQAHFKRLSNAHTSSKPHVNVQFCELNPPTEQDDLLNQFGPSLLPASNTIVVEYKRPDGYLLRIHTTDQSFPKLLREFARMSFD